MTWSSWLSARLDSWLPPLILTQDAHQVTRARLAVLMAFGTGLWGPIFGVYYAVLGLPEAAAIVAVGTAYLATTPWLLRRTASTEIAGHHTASALWFVIAGLSIVTGGITSTAPPWFAACGFLGLAVGGWRPGLTWLGVSLLTLGGLMVLELTGTPYATLTPTQDLLLRTPSMVGVALLVFSLVAVFQLEQDSLNKRLGTQVTQLREANRAKSLFLANMSHELRTPMNAILGYTELVSEELSGQGGESTQEDLGKVLTASRHLLALIDDLLDLSRVEMGELRIDSGVHEVDAICKDVIAALNPFATASGVKVVAELETSPAHCDRTRAAQIITNLTHNAIKFGGGAPVLIRCQTAAGVVSVEVIDEGAGLNSEQLARIFEEFQQAHPSIRATHGGTGLGLTISRKLARAMHGELRAFSVPGDGARFRLELPAA